MFKGHLPSAELLQRFPVLEDLYTPFISAIRKGDIRSYDASLDRFERRLVDLNLWLTLEKARELCIRGLFRRMYVLDPLNSSASQHTDLLYMLLRSSYPDFQMDRSREELAYPCIDVPRWAARRGF